MESGKSKELNPERVMEILKKKGTQVNIEEAKIILEFVNKFVHIAINQYLRGNL